MAREESFINYMDYLWVQVTDNMLTIGINDEGVADIDRIRKLELPPENEAVSADEVCGEITTDDGSIDLYSPVKGIVTELNQSVIENPALILEDPAGEGWLFKVEAEDTEELNEFVENSETGVDLDDEDDDDEDEDFDEDEDER